MFVITVVTVVVVVVVVGVVTFGWIYVTVSLDLMGVTTV